MESVQESDNKEHSRRGQPQQEEEEQRKLAQAHSNIHISSSHDLLYHEKRNESYKANSPTEARMVEIADNFQRQYSHLFPEHKPPLLCPENEHGVKKFVSTTLRPTAADHPELYYWKGCALFVADFLSLKPLESPIDLPRSLFSPSSVLQSQSATCFESATLLCSLLIGAHYEAYCVSGYAVKEMCERDQTLQKCPLLDADDGPVTSEPETPQNKYIVQPKRELESCFLMQQEKKKRDAEAALLLEQRLQTEHEELPADPLRGLRVHCWVLVLSGSRDVEENFFIDPLTGNNYATDDGNFLGIESVWDNYNYYANMQDCSNGCSDMVYDLEDLEKWEPVLASATSKKKLMREVLKRKENQLLGKITNELEVELWSSTFQMPQPWSSCIKIRQKDLENRYPGGKKVTHYRKAKLEKFSLYVESDGLVTRLTTFKDLGCTEVDFVKEWYRDRKDHLEKREVNKVHNVTTEHFRHGQRFHILLHRYSDTEREMEFNGEARADCLVRRVVSPGEMTETFEGRSDRLHYRHVEFLDPDAASELEGPALKKVEERFHRNTSIAANNDVAKRVFLLAENQIELTYHLEDFRTISSKRTFRKPQLATETHKAEDFTAANVHTFQVDLSAKPLTRLALYRMLQNLLEEEHNAIEHVGNAQKEVKDIMICREQEESDIQLILSPWTTAGAALARRQRLEKESRAAKQRRWRWQEDDNLLAPFLIRLNFPEAQSAEDTEKLIDDCLEDFKQKQIAASNLIKELYEKLSQELQEKQLWHQQNQLCLTREEEEEYQDYCSEKTLYIQVTKDRLERYNREAPEKYSAFHQRLLKDPRLSLQPLD